MTIGPSFKPERALPHRWRFVQRGMVVRSAAGRLDLRGPLQLDTIRGTKSSKGTPSKLHEADVVVVGLARFSPWSQSFSPARGEKGIRHEEIPAQPRHVTWNVLVWGSSVGWG